MYIQKIVPPYFHMLYLKPNYDVISYRIEYVKTNKKAKLSEAEAEALGLSTKDAKRYRIGMKYEPFLRIYRTIAPHSSVEQFVSNGGNSLEAFKKPSIIQDTQEEICFSTTFAATVESPIESSKRLSEGAIFKDSFYAINDEDRKKFKIVARSSKNNSIQSYEMKCLAIDEFFRKEISRLEDPQRCYENEIADDAIKDLSRVFNECSKLDTYSPDGFAETTSAFDNNLLAQILIVIKFLKWQVGLAKNLNDSILARPFQTRNILWYENELTSYGWYTGRISEADFIYDKYISEEYYDGIQKLMKANPHEEKQYKVKKSESCNQSDSYIMSLLHFDKDDCPQKKKKKFFQLKFEPIPGMYSNISYPDGEILCSYYEDPAKNGTIKSYWTKKMPSRTENILRDITIRDDIVHDRDKLIPELKRKLEAFYKDFIENLLEKDVKQYPPFIQKLLNNREKYMGNLIYAYYDNDGNIRKSITEVKLKDLKFIGYFDDMDCSEELEYWFIFDFIVERNAIHSIPEFIFNLLYLVDYSDVIKLAHESEQSKLTVYKALQNIKALDPDDTIAERLLARFVGKELEKTRSEFLKKWDNFIGESTFSTLDTEEDRMVEAFKIYYKTMQSITNMLEKANKLDPMILFSTNPNELPSLYKFVKDFMLDKLWVDSRLYLNKEFGRDAVNADIDIISYIKQENKKARLTRNKFAHGMDISKEEYVQFDNFCHRVRRIAETLEMEYIKKFKNIEDT